MKWQYISNIKDERKQERVHAVVLILYLLFGLVVGYYFWSLA